jgi:subtilisin family serine protease
MRAVVLILILTVLTLPPPLSASSSRYVLVTTHPLSDNEVAQLQKLGATVVHIYRFLPGAAITISPERVVEIKRLTFVKGVYDDGLVYAKGHVAGFTLDTNHIYNLDLIDAEPEDIGFTGKGVFVAVLDTGLIANWRDYLREESVDTTLAINFVGAGATPNFNKWEHDTNSHGLAVAASIVGYKLSDDSDEGGFLHQPVTGSPQTKTFVRGVAPDAKIIPVKVLENAGFGFFSDVIAGIDYVIGLVVDRKVDGRVVINMSLGASVPFIPLEVVINEAIERGVIVVAAAGNEGDDGMSWPGAYPQVISAGAIGWIHEFGQPASGQLPAPPDNTWWSRDFGGSENPPEGKKAASEVFVVFFSSRERDDVGAQFICADRKPCDQDLDVVAPGRRVLLPFLCVGLGLGSCGVPQPPADPVPQQDEVPPRYLFISGTSFSSPHVAGIAALMLEKNPGLTQSQIEKILEATALKLPDRGEFLEVRSDFKTFIKNSWDNDIFLATGAGLVQARAALSAVTKP